MTTETQNTETEIRANGFKVSVKTTADGFVRVVIDDITHIGNISVIDTSHNDTRIRVSTSEVIRSDSRHQSMGGR